MPFVLTDKRVIQPVTTGDVTLAFRRFEGDERDEFDKLFAKILNGPKKHYLNSVNELARQVAAKLLVYWIGVNDDQDQPIGEPYKGGGSTLIEGAFVPSTEQALAFFLHRESLPYWDSHISSYLWPRRKKATKGQEAEESDDGEAVTVDFLFVK